MQHLYGFLSMCHFDCKVSDEAGGVIAFCQITSPSLAPEDVALPPITTPTYAIEFQKAIQASSRGRDVLTVQVGRDLLASGQQQLKALFCLYVAHFGFGLLCDWMDRLLWLFVMLFTYT